jgi:RNA polymerase sigma-70 factor (ECF subfamily)
MVAGTGPARARGAAGVDGWIDAARAGDREALGRAVEACRRYLLLVADRELAPEIKAKEGASDLVQDAMVLAQRRFGAFAGRSEAELRAWLRRIVKHLAAHAVRRYRESAKRRLESEVPLAPGGGPPTADDANPAALAMRLEALDALDAAIGRLPDRSRQVVLWRHFEGCSFDAIGRRLGCSNVAARKSWLRALGRLRADLADGLAR